MTELSASVRCPECDTRRAVPADRYADDLIAAGWALRQNRWTCPKCIREAATDEVLASVKKVPAKRVRRVA